MTIPQFADQAWSAGKTVCPSGGVAVRAWSSAEKETIVDSTLISAPSSTKNGEKKRNPETHSVNKNLWL